MRRAIALRYALAPACVLLVALVHLSPAGALFPFGGLFFLAVVGAAGFGGAGPGLLAAVLATFTLPQLVTVSYPLLGGVFDLPRFVTFSFAGLAVGWWSFRRRKVEAALRVSEERHARAMEASAAGHWDWNMVTDELFVSERAQEMFDLPPGRLPPTRTEFLSLLSKYRADMDAGVQDSLQSGRFDRIYRVVPRTGPVRWLSSRGELYRDAAGKPVRMAGSVTDITERKLVEEALRNSAQRYALAMEAAGDGHTDWDLVTGEFYISPRLLEMVGHPPDATFADRADWVRRFPFHPEDRPKWEAAIAAHHARRELHFKMELRIVVRGEVRWTAFHFLSTRDAAGNAIRWTGSIGDITEQKRVEERIRLAMEASEEGYIDCDVPTDRFIVSERMREIFEVAPGTRIAYRSDFNQQFRFYSDEDARIYGDGIRTMCAQGGPDRFEFEFRVVLPSGKVKWIWTRSKVTRDAEGRALRRIGVVADVTARKLAEQALRESEDRFARAVAGSSDGVWDIDLVGRTVYFSPRTRELCGLPPGPEVNPLDGWFEKLPLHPEDLPRRFAAVNAHLSGKAPAYDGEFRFLQPDGVYRWRHLHGVCVRDADGKPLRMAGSMSDVDDRRRAEEELRESEARKSAMFETALDCIVSIDHEGRVVEFNSAAERTFGYSRAEAMGKELAELIIPPRLREQHRQGLARYLKTGEGPVLGRRVELPALRADGSEFLVELSVTRIASAGTPLFTAYLRDITERKRMEEALRESKARYERVVAATEAGLWDWDTVEDKYYVSPRLLEMAGLPPDTIIADRADFMARVPFHPEDQARWQREMQALFASGESRLSTEARVMLATGTRWVRLDGMCFRDAAGKVVRWTGSAIDVTPRKLAERALRESEQGYELAMAASESGYWDWNIPTNRYFASPRALELAGFPPGTTWVTRDQYRANINMHPEDFARWEAEREALFAGTGERLSMEVRYVVRGENRWHLLHAICRRDAAGKVVRWGGSATDITERKKAEEELLRMERKLRQAQRLEAMGTLAGGIAHDFNNILGAMLAYGEMAQRDAPDGSRLARDLSRIMTAGERGRALVDRVLTFSRSAVGERGPVEVERVVREVLDLIMARLPPNVTVHPKLHAAGAAVLADATQLHQLVSNLATNAVQAMPAGGTLRVALALERVETPRSAMIGGCGTGDYVVVTVADTGSGIAPEILEHIFDPYFTTKDVGAGTGLGLSLVHGIVTGLGGAIDVATTPGAGSTFTIYLPRCAEAAEPRGATQSALPGGEGQRVLIVDDEEAMVELATRTLETLGYVPVGFTSSTAALAAFRADPERFDAVITDERMPGVSGSMLIREVRRLRGRLPIVLMSGYLGGGLAEQAREAGADEVLKKPVSAHDVASGLARALQSSGGRRLSPVPEPARARGS